MDKIQKTEEEWKKELTPEQYRIMREKETESPFSGKYADTKEDGIYRCSACGNPLFSSNAKFESGTGWPSYFEPISAESVETKPDTSQGMSRIEVVCGRCGAHLGHVFDDLPPARAGGVQAGGPPNARRYCVNSVCLDLEKKNKKGAD